MVVISVYTYDVKIIKKFRWESGFHWGGSMEPPRYALTEVRGTLCSYVLSKRRKDSIGDKLWTL